MSPLRPTWPSRSEAAPGAPADPTTHGDHHSAGTQAQSVPAQGQTPQTFETSARHPAKADWNALRCRPACRGAAGDTRVYLAGTSTQLNPGDAILIVGDERAKSAEATTGTCASSARSSRTPQPRTLVIWKEAIGARPAREPAKVKPEVLRLAAEGGALRLQRRRSAYLAAQDAQRAEDRRLISSSTAGWDFGADKAR